MYGYNFPSKREDSIDSGYADSWTGPALLARSPPHSTRNSIAFDSTPFRRASISLLQDRRVSYDVRGIRPSPRQSVIAEEHDDDASLTLSILDAYDSSSDLDEEPLSPTVRLTGMVLTPPLSPPVEPSVPISESAPIHDSALEASSLQRDSTPEDGTGHAFFDADSPLESLVSPLSSSTARPSSVTGTFPTQTAVLVDMKLCSLPPSPLPEPAASDAVHIVGRLDDVITPSSVSWSVNDSEFMEGELSSKMSLLSLGNLPSGRSSPNTSILSAECDYTVDDMTQETVFSQPSSPPQSGIAPAQSPASSSVWDDDDMDGYGLQEDQLYTNHPKEGQESSIVHPGERPRISRELLAHIGHVFSLSDDMLIPAGDALDPNGSGSDVQTDDGDDSWHNDLNADVQQALRMSSMSPVMFLSDDADFDHDEAGVRTSWNPQLDDFSVDLRRWSGEENVLSVEEGASASSVEHDESDALCGPPGPEGLLQDVVSLPATLEPPAGQAIGTRDIDTVILQGKRDIQTAHFHDQSLVDTSTVNDSSAATFGSVDTPSIVEFVQRSRAISDATVKPDSQSPSAPCFLPTPMAFIPANLVDPNTENHADFLQPLDDRSVDAQPASMEATAVKLDIGTGESPNLHPASVFESTGHDHEEKRSSVLTRTGSPATHRASLNLTIRIPSTFEAQPSSSSTAQSLPLILSLSNGCDTRRWFSPHTDGLSSIANSPSTSAPVTSNLPSREAGSTKVPFGFRRCNPQFAARKPLRGVRPSSSVSPAFYPATRRESDAASAFFPPNSSSTNQLLSPVELQQESSTTGLKPLRLSSLLNPRSSVSSSSSIMSNILSDHLFNSSSPHSPNVSSSTSLSHNSLLPSPCSSSIPEHIPEHIHKHIHNTLTPAHDSSSSSFAFTPAPSSRVHSVQRESQLHSAPVQQAPSWRLSRCRGGSRDFNQSFHPSPRRLSTLSLAYDDEEEDVNEYNRTIRRSVSGLPPRSSSVLEAPVHAIATPKPTLLFAIASDDVNEVRQVLESGEAGPNDQVGPQSALAFTLTNDKLSHKNEIVKALLAYGADPSALRNPDLNPSAQASSEADQGVSSSHSQPGETMPEGMDPATRYYVTRADSTHTRQTSQLIYRSFFRPLTRVRYDLIGQDWVLEQLFRVLSMHSQRLSVAPIVVLLCGPSGHGKSLLARKFGSLLDIPTHTVNMTTLRSTHDLWQSYSMSPYEEPSSDTLAQFLLNNEGERCVVVLDEIEKVEDPKALYSLLMPWELGRCSLETGKRHVDLTKVIWLGTSNIGHNLVFEHHDSRPDPSKPVTREEYRDLMDLSRPHVSQCLGASLLSRVTTVLPFIPFTVEEKMAIAAEAVYSLTSNAAKTLSPQDVEEIVMKVLPSYIPSEGARSLHRAVSNQLVDLV
ncbi:hypothetical protein EDB19DRAFT_347124 [Suillus lakei]|nr:hypothetical protein EDB19DRAFT_347124 [Suillus lakei]